MSSSTQERHVANRKSQIANRKRLPRRYICQSLRLPISMYANNSHLQERGVVVGVVVGVVFGVVVGFLIGVGVVGVVVEVVVGIVVGVAVGVEVLNYLYTSECLSCVWCP